MKIGYRLFLFLALFYAILTAIYAFFTTEWVGIVAMALSSGLALIIGYYFWFINRRSGGVLPEDNLQGEISDGAGELGFFSPHSWWPLALAVCTIMAGLGLIIGWWLTAIAAGLLILSIIGFVTEYEKSGVGSH